MPDEASNSVNGSVTEFLEFQRAKARREYQGLLEATGHASSGDDVDSYGVVQSTTYDRKEFYIGGTDKRGMSVQKRLRVPPQVAQRIAQLIQSGSWPWRTDGEFMVDAVFHRLRDVAEWTGDGGMNRMMAVMRIASRQELINREVADLEKVVSEFRTTCETAQRNGDWASLTTSLIHMSNDMDEIRDPYRRQVQGLIAQYLPMMPAEYRPEL